MPAEKIIPGESMAKSFPKINKAIQDAYDAATKSTNADQNSNLALIKARNAETTAKSIRTEFSAVIERETDSDAMSRQAAVDITGTDKGNLKVRLDDDYKEINSKIDDNLIKLDAVKSKIADTNDVLKQNYQEVNNKIEQSNVKINETNTVLNNAQKFKMTKDDGTAKTISESSSGGSFVGDILSLEAGHYNFNVTGGQVANLPPMGLANGSTANVMVHVSPGTSGRKTIDFIYNYENRFFRGVVHDTFRGWKELTNSNTGTITNDAIVQQLQSDMASRVSYNEASNWQQYALTKSGNGQSKSLGSFRGDIKDLGPGFWEGSLDTSVITSQPITEIPDAPNGGMAHLNVWLDSNGRKVIMLTYIHSNKTYIGTLNLEASGGWRGWKDLTGYESMMKKYPVTPDYFSSNLLTVAESVKQRQKPNSLVFGFITDTHYATVAENRKSQKLASLQHFKNISEIQKYIGFDFKVHGGDVVDGDQERVGNAKDLTECLGHFFNDTCPSFVVKGNHDDASWYAQAKAGNLLSNVINEQGLYARLVRPAEKFGIVQDARYPERGYYYYDVERKKTRVICLNAFDNPYIANSDGTNKYISQNQSAFRNEQINWLANQALSVPSGYKVVVFTHHPLKGTFSDIQQINGEAIVGLLEAFKAGRNYTGSGTVADFNYSVNKTFNTPGDIIAVICGHTHKDAHTTKNGILYIQCLNSLASQDSETMPARLISNYSEDAFDIFVADFDNRKLYAQRFGAGSNREFSF